MSIVYDEPGITYDEPGVFYDGEETEVGELCWEAGLGCRWRAMIGECR